MAAQDKKFGLVATFPYKMEEVVFVEAYGATYFLYATESARNTALNNMRKRCYKKGINVKFKLVTKESTEE